MATALQRQLASIAAKSTDPLDLKKQRKEHSKSLIFEPKQAERQDFDTLYDICIEGFQQLCGLDRRFIPFSKTVFAERSKEQDRTQLTATQNQELDGVIESFLSLAIGRLLLKPARLTIEWLVRRFRIHEYNTEAILFTFLPFHNRPDFANTFAALLQILPSKLPHNFRFLAPYKESLSPPPRHPILFAAIHDDAFFRSLNTYIIGCCRRGHEHDALTEFWASVVVESIAGKIDLAGSRREARQRKEEDIVRQILETLNDAFTIANAKKLRIACYAILSVLVSKIQLSNHTLKLLLEAVCQSAKSVGEAELVCLGVLSQYMQDRKLPSKACEAIFQNSGLLQQLKAVSGKYEISALVLGLTLHACSSAIGLPTKLQLVLEVVHGDLIKGDCFTTALQAIAEALKLQNTIEAESRQTIVDALQKLADTADISPSARSALEEIGISRDVETPLALLDDGGAESPGDEMEIDEDSMFEQALSQVAKQTVDANPASFLTNQSSATYDLLAKAALSAQRSHDSWSRLTNLNCFQVRGKQALLVSFLIRYLSEPAPASTRAMAISQLTQFVREHSGCDFQLMLPYVLTYLSDQSAIIRKSASTLLAAIRSSVKQSRESTLVFAKDDFYGHVPSATLSLTQLTSTLNLLAQGLEEYVLDPSQVSRVLRDILAGVKAAGKQEKSLKTAEREALLIFLVGAVEATPLITDRIRLLNLLSGVSKVGSTTKTKAVLPLLRSEIKESRSLEARLVLDANLARNYWTQLLETITAGSGDGLKLIRDTIVDSNTSVVLREIAIQRMGRLWPAVKAERQPSLAESIFEIVRTESEEIPVAVRESAVDCLRSLKLPSAALLALVEALPKLSDILKNEASPKRRKTANGHVNTGVSNIIATLQQWAFVLELVEAANDTDNSNLLKRLNHMLVEMHTLHGELGSQAQYLEALLLDAITSVVQTVCVTDEAQLKAAAMPIDTIIELFQVSSSAQVQRSALMLVALLARVFPDATLHHIMPVFAKMGQSMLQQTDEFSVHVADLAVNSIIPPLLESFRKQKSGLQEGVVRVLLSFVVAYDHIPQDRRLPLFSSLVNQLGPGNSLHVLALLIIEKHARSKGVDDFIAELFTSFPAHVQLQALRRSIDIVDDACSEQPTSLTAQIIPSKDRKARINTSHHFLSLTVKILQDPELHRRIETILRTKDELSDQLRTLYSDLTEHILRLGTLMPAQKRFVAICTQCLDSLLGLMPVHETISGLEPLLTNKDPLVQRQALRSVEQRVSQIRVKDSAAQTACLGLLPRLQSLLVQSNDAKLCQAIVSCTDSIIERFGKKDASQSLSIMRIIASDRCLSSDSSVKVMALFCLATAVQTLGESVISLLPQALKLTFQVMDAAVTEKPDAAVFNAALALVEVILDNMPWVLPRAQIQLLLTLIAKAPSIGELAEATAEARTSSLELLARRSEPRDSLSALRSTWTEATKHGLDAMTQHLAVFQTIVSTIPKATTIKLTQSLLDLFLEVMGTASNFADGNSSRLTIEDLEAVENSASEIMVQVIYKLNDTHFRPIFMRLLDWASASDARKHYVPRHAALYSFLRRFFETLKSIVTNYSGLIIEDAVSILQNGPRASLLDRLLWTRLIQTLTAAFEHDQDEYFQAPTRFGVLAGPLVDQLARSPELKDGVQNELIPCIVAFASSADSSENQKAINTAVLTHLRADSQKVRMAVVKCQRELTEALSDEWLTHLPEMLPFISDALEDDDEEVQNETRAWVSRIESIIGESLGPMLQ